MPVPTLLLDPPSLSAVPDTAGVARMSAETGAYLELAQLFALRPDLYDAIGKTYDAFFRNPASALTAEERELSALVVALLANSRYPEQLHRARLAELGVDVAIIATIDARDFNSDGLSHRQRAFLNFVRKITAFPHTIVDKDIIYLKQNGFEDPAILELGALAAYVQMLGRIADAYNVGV